MNWTDEELAAAFRLREIDPYAFDLLQALLDRIEAEIVPARGIELPSDGWTFMLLTLERSLTAGRQSSRLLATGYPWLSLYLGRLLLESYVAVTWGIGRPDEAHNHFRDFRKTRERARVPGDLGAGT